MSQGNVLALQGPMGNGKTTLVKDGISKAIGRPFSFIALGGQSDSSLFEGHSYTYEGSHWGRIIDILIDEVKLFGNSLDKYYKEAGAGFWGAMAFIFSIIISLILLKLMKQDNIKDNYNIKHKV